MHFSFDNMQLNCNEMQNIVNKLVENLRNIDEIFNSFHSSDFWQGNAYQYYYRKFKEITNQFDDVCFNMQNFVIYLQQVIENYSSLDRKIMMAVSNQLNITEKFKG